MKTKTSYAQKIIFDRDTSFHVRAAKLTTVLQNIREEGKHEDLEIIGSTLHMDATDHKGLFKWLPEDLVKCEFAMILYKK